MEYSSAEPVTTSPALAGSGCSARPVSFAIKSHGLRAIYWQHSSSESSCPQPVARWMPSAKGSQHEPATFHRLRSLLQARSNATRNTRRLAAIASRMGGGRIPRVLLRHVPRRLQERRVQTEHAEIQRCVRAESIVRRARMKLIAIGLTCAVIYLLIAIASASVWLGDLIDGRDY